MKSENVFYGYRTKRPGSIINSSTCINTLDSVMIIIEELFNNHERLKFTNGEAWANGISLEITYDRITKELENLKDEVYFSQKVLFLLDNYIIKYDIEYSKEIQGTMDILRSISNS